MELRAISCKRWGKGGSFFCHMNRNSGNRIVIAPKPQILDVGDAETDQLWGQAKLLKIKKGCQRILERPSATTLICRRLHGKDLSCPKLEVPVHVQKSWMGSVGPDRHEVKAPSPQKTNSPQLRKEG